MQQENGRKLSHQRERERERNAEVAAEMAFTSAGVGAMAEMARATRTTAARVAFFIMVFLFEMSVGVVGLLLLLSEVGVVAEPSSSPPFIPDFSASLSA